MLEKIGRFEINGVLGRGAMGEVYLATDPIIGREVAIKTILPSVAQGDEAKLRFTREAKAAGVLNHPNLVTIYEFGEDQGVLFIAMERVKGQDLAEMLHEHCVSPSDALELLAQVCDGLEFAHRNSIIHRDIKPSNIRVLRDGRRLHVKVMDFGVARLKDSEMTSTGTIVGTVNYMAPEYIRIGKADARSDLFAVGVMLYECMSGRRPFDGETAPTILYRIVNEAPDPIDLSELKDISPAIRSVLDTAMAKDPDARYQTAGEFARALRAAKDPTWQGLVDEKTTLLKTRPATGPITPPPPPPPLTGTVPMPVPEPAPAFTPVLTPVPKTSRLFIALAITGSCLFGLGIVTGGGYYLYKQRMLRSGEQAASQDETLGIEASLDQAITAADTDPARAVALFQRWTAAHPKDANGYAWTVALLYEQKRYGEIPGVFKQARKNGVTRAKMMNNLRFRSAMFNNNQEHLIPEGGGE